VKRVSGLDGSSFHGPLCRVGVTCRSASADVRQVGGDSVCFVSLLFGMSDAGERNVVWGGVCGVVRRMVGFGAVTRWDRC
jgi:hypothetical protein